MTAASRVGRAKTLLVAGQASEALGVVVPVVARLSDQTERLRIVGLTRPDADSEQHLRELVVPMVEDVCIALGVQPRGVRLSYAMTSAATEGGYVVRGASHDCAVALALLSTQLDLPLRQDLATTGHLASVDGDVSPVMDLAAKLRAVQDDPETTGLVYPLITRQNSMARLCPQQYAVDEAAVRRASTEVSLHPVQGLADVLRALTKTEDVAAASLRMGYFNRELPCSRPVTGRDDCVDYLASSDHLASAMRGTVDEPDPQEANRRMLEWFKRFGDFRVQQYRRGRHQHRPVSYGV